MKSWVILGCWLITLLAIAAIITHVDAVFIFLIAGHVPGTAIALPTVWMVVLLFLILPGLLLWYRPITEVYWHIIDLIGRRHQARLRRQAAQTRERDRQVTMALPNLAMIGACVLLMQRTLAQAATPHTTDQTSRRQLAPVSGA